MMASRILRVTTHSVRPIDTGHISIPMAGLGLDVALCHKFKVILFLGNKIYRIHKMQPLLELREFGLWDYTNLITSVNVPCEGHDNVLSVLINQLRVVSVIMMIYILDALSQPLPLGQTLNWLWAGELYTQRLIWVYELVVQILGRDPAAQHSRNIVRTLKEYHSLFANIVKNADIVESKFAAYRGFLTLLQNQDIFINNDLACLPHASKVVRRLKDSYIDVIIVLLEVMRPELDKFYATQDPNVRDAIIQGLTNIVTGLAFQTITRDYDSYIVWVSGAGYPDEGHMPPRNAPIPILNEVNAAIQRLQQELLSKDYMLQVIQTIQTYVDATHHGKIGEPILD